MASDADTAEQGLELGDVTDDRRTPRLVHLGELDDVADDGAIPEIDADRAAHLRARHELRRNEIVEGPVKCPSRDIDYDRCDEHAAVSSGRKQL